MNKYRFIFQNGDIITRVTTLDVDDAIIKEYSSRLNQKKTPKMLQIFSWDESKKEFVAIKKESVTITLKPITL